MNSLYAVVVALVLCSWNAFAEDGPNDALSEAVVGKAATFTRISIPNEFSIGSPESEPGRCADEFQRQVSTSDFMQDFEIQVTPVTQLQYFLVRKHNPSAFRTPVDCPEEFQQPNPAVSLCPQHPVERVNQQDVEKFIEKLNEQSDRYIYRLPTEAEYEYAARAGTSTAYFFGDSSARLGDYAWFEANSEGSTHKVASKLPNPYGLYDIIGNVSQLTSDWYDVPVDQHSITLGKTTRGGNWFLSAASSRSASKGFLLRWDRSSYIGFRIVRTPKSNITFKNRYSPARTTLPKGPEVAFCESKAGVSGKFVKIRAGTFLMGSPEHEVGRRDNERQHRVTLTRDYEIQSAPTTLLMYHLIMGRLDGSQGFVHNDIPDDCRYSRMPFPEGQNYCAHHPASGLTWYKVQDFLKILNENSKQYIYRLPTEAEYEFAIRGGTTTAYFFGESAEAADQFAWYGNSQDDHHDVGLKAPNPYGLYDIVGNSLEWVNDKYSDDLGPDPVIDPTGSDAEGENVPRVLRGGNASVGATGLRSAWRKLGFPRDNPMDHTPINYDATFRLVRVPK